ncbi:MAG: tetratricopeptide repeat protein, partial [Cyanobacteria bacterium J06558_2]
AVFGIYRHHVQSPAKNFIILVAKFEDSNSKDYSVTQEIFSHLEREMNSYSDVKVEKLDKSLLSIRAAREEGKRKKAAIVIWGRYPIIGKIVPFSVNFEILNQPPEFPELEPAVKGQSQPKAIDQLTSFKLQTTLSQEMTYLSFFTLGMYRYFEEDWEQAIDYLSKAIKVFKNIENQFISDSHLKLVYFHLGNIRGRKGDYQGAINDYNKIIKINSKFYHAYHNRGFAYAKLGDAQSALTDYDLAVKLNPESATTYYNRGLIYGRDLGDYRQALANFTKSIELASDDAQVYVDRGNAYQLLKKIESAVDDYSQAIRINPQHAQAHYNRGIAYSQQNEPEKALQDLQRASTLFQAQGNSANYQRTLDRIREIQRI